MALARLARSFDTAFGILLCASIVVNPIAWDHYMVLTAIPMTIVFRRLRDVSFPFETTTLARAAFVLTILPNVAYLTPALHFAVGDLGRLKILPFAAGLVTYVPLVPLTGWVGLLWATDAIDVPGPEGAPT
jgi:hypothetical protein